MRSHEVGGGISGRHGVRGGIGGEAWGRGRYGCGSMS